jgi:hypothetical protein
MNGYTWKCDMTIWFDDAHPVLECDDRAANITVLLSAATYTSGTRNCSPCHRSRVAPRHPRQSWASPTCTNHGSEWMYVEPTRRCSVQHGPESSRIFLGTPRCHRSVAEVRRDQKQTGHHDSDGQADHPHPGNRLHFALDAALVAAFHPA